MNGSASDISGVLIIGGGLAGLAAAVGLTLHSVPVTLLESRNRLGGRASSFDDRESGDTVDNCQHVGMGCCTNLRHLCRIVGVADRFTVERELTFLDDAGRASRLGASAWLPAPLHLVPSFLRLRFLKLREKWSIAGALRKLAQWRRDPERADESFRDWLVRNGQSERVMERFWEVVLVSALSESLDRIDVGYARKVFVDGFLRHRRGGEVDIPRTSLDRIFGPPFQDWLTVRGSEVRIHARVSRLVGDTQGIQGVELRTGESLPAREFILAVPQHQVRDLLPEAVRSGSEWSRLESIETAPISSLHLWFDRAITPLPHAVLVNRMSQWVFQQPRDDAAVEIPWRYQIVISASRALREMRHEEIRDRVLEELRSLWPEVANARLLHWRVVTEHRAVFSVTPGIDTLRPQQQSSIPNLQLAGDWTATGWPSTMESAVRSGFLAAENVLLRLGRSVQLLQPDLPTALLARPLLGPEATVPIS